MYRLQTRRGEKKELIFLFFLFFMLGIVTSLIISNVHAHTFLMLSRESCMEVMRMEWEYPKLFFRCLIKREMIILLLPALTLSKVGIWGIRGACGWFSFSLGAVMEMMALQYGMYGLALFVVGIFPHYLIYIPVYIRLYLLCLELWVDRKGKILQLVLLFGVVIIGVLLESYVNPIILKSFLKLFFSYIYYM